MSTYKYKKCAKCGASAAQDASLTFHRFPKPGSTNILRATAFATYCWPERDWSSLKCLVDLHKTSKVLCGQHFQDSCFTDSSKKRLFKYSIPGTKEYGTQLLQSLRTTQTGSMTDKMAITEKEILHGVPLATTDYEDDPPVLSQNSQIESSINVDTGEEEVLETEEIVYDDGYRCPSPEVVEKEIPKVLPVLCVKCSQLIETHLYVCASCSDSQYEPLCATCAEHAALDAHAACYVLRARVTRPKSEIRGVLCAIRSELAMKSFADDLEDAVTDIKSETADIPEDTDVLDVDPFDEIDSAVAVSAEGDPNASLTTSDNEDTDDGSSEHEYTASVADRTVQDLLSLKPEELDVTTENECHKSPHPATCFPSPKTVNVVQRRDEPQLASTLKPLRTTIGINIIRNDAQPKLQAIPASKGTLAPATVQSDDTKSAVPTGLKRLRDDIESYAKAKKVKSNNSQQVRTKLITLKQGVNILRKDLQIQKLKTMKEPGVQRVPTPAQNVESPIMPKGVKEKALCSDELTMEPEDFKKLSDQLRNCKVVLKDLILPPNVKKVKVISKQYS